MLGQPNPHPKTITLSEREWLAIENEYLRRDFHAYRKHMAHKRGQLFLDGWFQRDVAKQLKKFWIDFKSGNRPVLIISAPPQHGKSTQIIDFCTWALGQDPNVRTIYSSYSQKLGVKANLNIQRIMSNSAYQRLFPDSKMLMERRHDVIGQSRRNSNTIEMVGHNGCFINTTVLGQITGESLDLGIIDDPLKGRKASQSPAIRESTWEWFTDDFFTRFSEKSGMIVVATRWHVDDPTGRILKEFPKARIVNYPALAIQDEKHRQEGEALFPELKSKEFLLERKKVMALVRWGALYQGDPKTEGSGLFKVNEFKIVEHTPFKVKRKIRYWDKAGTDGGGAYTAGVKMGIMQSGEFVVMDVVRDQLSAFGREQLIKRTAMMDGVDTEIMVEQEPGSGGKESAENTIAMLAGYNVRKERVVGNKELRADPYSAQVEAGNVYILRAKWNKDFIDEHECLDGSSEVLVKSGNKKIKDVQVGDLVWTRKGWRKVIKSGKTGVKPLYEIVTSTGRRLRATANHPIFVEGFGFKRVDSLMEGDSLLQFTRVSSSVGSRESHLILDPGQEIKHFCCIGLYLKTKLDQFLRVMRSTIRTAIRPITRCLTSLPCLLKSIVRCQGEKKIITAKSVAPNISAPLVNKGSFVRGNVLINFMVKGLGPESAGNAILVNLGSMFGTTRARNISTAVENASMKAEGKKGKLKERSHVRNAKSHSLDHTPHLPNDFVAEVVQIKQICKVYGKCDVYNLEVEDVHEFVANSILVHNCFPSGKFKDQVDAASGAFNNLCEHSIAEPDVR